MLGASGVIGAATPYRASVVLGASGVLGAAAALGASPGLHGNPRGNLCVARVVTSHPRDVQKFRYPTRPGFRERCGVAQVAAGTCCRKKPYCRCALSSMFYICFIPMIALDLHNRQETNEKKNWSKLFY